jgi:cell wall-associated NlpC family hydrolase
MPVVRGGGLQSKITGQAIARDALRYKGQGYVYGGPASTPGDWDCSSFVSYVLGHDLKMTLPGGGSYGQPGYPPSSHGPVVVDYAGFGSAVASGQEQAGDLACWVGVGPLGHVGIVTGRGQMISALNPSLGTLVTPIQGTGPAGAPLVFRRVTGVPGGQYVPPAPGTGGGMGQAALAGLLVVAGMAVIVIASAAVLGTVTALAGAWAVRKAAGGGVLWLTTPTRS